HYPPLAILALLLGAGAIYTVSTLSQLKRQPEQPRQFAGLFIQGAVTFALLALVHGIVNRFSPSLFLGIAGIVANLLFAWGRCVVQGIREEFSEQRS
ncbi:MAG: hypothetical protein AAGG44_13300, partial [Planctomycetota bacterium]